VAAEFERHGAGVVDTDRIARALVAPGGAARAPILEAFGPQYLGADGEIDRRALREHVFYDAEARTQIESILHPMIRAEVERALSCVSTAYALLVVPLLVEHVGAYRPLFDRVLVVDCPAGLQLRRLMARDGIDDALAQRMLAAQSGRDERMRLADDVIDNGEGGADHIPARVAQLHAEYLKLAMIGREDALP